MKAVRVVALFLVLGMMGCSTAPKVAGKAKTMDEVASAQVSFWLDQRMRASELTDVLGKLRLRYQTPKDSIGGRGQMLTQGTKQVRMELRDPLGKLHFLAIADGDQFTAVYPRRKVAYSDKVSGLRYFNKTLGLGLSFHDIEAFALGELPAKWKKDAFDRWDWDPSIRMYVGRLEWPDRSMVVRVDPDRLVLREVDVELGKESFTLRYADYATCCRLASTTLKESQTRFNVAHRIELAAVQRKSGIEIEFDEVQKIDGRRPKSAFEASVPQGAKHIVLD